MKKAFLFVLCLLFVPGRSFAGDSSTVMQKRVMLVAKSAAYGAAGGIVIGLASQVAKRKTQNIFLCGSLGLYAGIILGIYILNSNKGPKPYEGPDTYKDEDYSQNLLRPEITGTIAKVSEPFSTTKPSMQMNLLSVSF